MKTHLLALLSAAVIGGGVTVGHAADYSIDWYSIDGGGGTSTGGAYTLTGTIGQSDAGTLTGGNYQLTGGFMSIVTAIQTPGGPQLTITRSGSNVIISWPDPSTGYVLEQTGVLAAMASNTVWTDTPGVPVINGGQKQVTVAAPVGNRYYRLRKP